MTHDDIELMTSEVSVLMATRLGLHGADLAVQVARAGRMMPRSVRRDARYLAQTASLAQNPKLIRMVDLDRVSRSHQVVTGFLRTQNPAERRITSALGIAAVIAFNLLILAFLVVIVLVWRGYA